MHIHENFISWTLNPVECDMKSEWLIGPVTDTVPASHLADENDACGRDLAQVT